MGLGIRRTNFAQYLALEENASRLRWFDRPGQKIRWTGDRRSIQALIVTHVEKDV
jgi:hypothetical protein